MLTYREGGVSQRHDVAHAALDCSCLTDEDLEWDTMSELGYLRFGYRLYVAYSSSERFKKRIRRGYAAGWAELFGESDSPGAGAPPPPMFDAEDRPLDFSCHPEMEKVYPVPWPVPRIQDLQDELNAPPPTPPEILAGVPAPLGPVVAGEGDDMDVDVGGTETGLPATSFHAPPPSSRSVTRESSLSTLSRSPSPDTTPEVNDTSFATHRGVSAAGRDSPAPPLTTPAIFYAPPPVSQPTPTVFYAPPAPVPFPQSQFTMRYTPPPPPLPQKPSKVTFAASVSTTAAQPPTTITPITSRIPPIVDHLLSEIDEVREALEAEREMRMLGDEEVRKLRDEIAEMRRMIKERVGRR
ncbi:hypothetical protein DFP72DRAFT_634887 [Ephemerocybe angulata]|uniref:Uncharacterized protein n=1 Tax=Ephemerocybe angulata TaxID=980116 RepID=A0A8H6HHL7_9AGAR|nr:hypothetical protein DFP72DRAFT_634887 [Tulosesus angulatus]